MNLKNNLAVVSKIFVLMALFTWAEIFAQVKNGDVY